MADYKYDIFDAQYYLTRNFKALIRRYTVDTNLLDSNDKPILNEEGEPITYPTITFTADDLARTFFYSIVKFTREIASCRKVILLFDKYPYHKDAFVEEYKGTRHYATEEDLEGIDKETSPLDYAVTEEEIRRNKIKQEAKYWIINNFDKLGMKVYVRTGYEADDFAGIIARYLRNDDEKSVIVSIDDDWTYFVNENVDYLKPNGTKITYEDMKQELITHTEPSWNFDLYKFKSYIDSLYGSHNDLVQTLKHETIAKCDIKTILKSLIEDNDFSILENPELFKAQLASFGVETYPEYDMVIKSLWYLDKGGSVINDDDFIQFTLMNNFGVRVQYYSDFRNELDKSLYKGK